MALSRHRNRRAEEMHGNGSSEAFSGTAVIVYKRAGKQENMDQAWKGEGKGLMGEG